jgi:hypothetical protein
METKEEGPMDTTETEHTDTIETEPPDTDYQPRITLRKRKMGTEKKSITLFIQAHGGIIKGSIIPKGLAQDCKILSFTGAIGRAGIMKRDCNGIEMGSISIGGQQILPRIPVKGEQLDMMALSYTQQVYSNINKLLPIGVSNEKSNLSFDLVHKNIPKIYENCGVTKFRGSIISATPYGDLTPFSDLTPTQDKNYWLYPNEHEDCVFRGKCSRLGCEVLEKKDQICPYYGVYVVYSSIPEDFNYTLCGLQEEKEEHTKYNLNIMRGSATKQYWSDKLEQHMRGETEIAAASHNLSNIATSLSEEGGIITLYEKMTRFLDDDLPISEQTIMEYPLPTITLSQLLTIFKTGMGYDEVIIIDPSCDSCKYSNKRLITLSQQVLRDIRQGKQTARASSQTYGGKKTRRKRKSRKLKKIRKRKTYKKRKHIKMSYK